MAVKKANVAVVLPWMRSCWKNNWHSHQIQTHWGHHSPHPIAQIMVNLETGT
jgi:hypothetical protein